MSKNRIEIMKISGDLIYIKKYKKLQKYSECYKRFYNIFICDKKGQNLSKIDISRKKKLR